MIRNYIKIAVRSFNAHKVNAVVNILGLAVGIASALIILSIIQFEMSFDKFHSDSDRIYRVVRISQFEGQEEYRTNVPYPLPIALKDEISSMENVTTILYWNWSGVQIEVIDDQAEKPIKFQETNGFAFIEPTFFEIFDFNETGVKWLSGNPKTALVEPMSIVLTQSISQKYFGNESALGKTLRVDDTHNATVTGVIEDFPNNTDFPFTIMMSYSTMLQSVGDSINDWVSIGETECYVKLPSFMTKDEMDENIEKLHVLHTSKELNAVRKYKLQKLSDVHQDNRFGNYNNRIVSEGKLWALAIIGVFLLLTACINYINLTTAQSALRSKEIGIRKVMGSSKVQLVTQFMSEALCLALIAGLTGLLIAELLVSNFQALLSTPTSIHLIFDPYILKSLVGILALITFFAGLYPALVISAFNPLNAIKNKLTAPRGSIPLRKVLVVLQFCISLVFVIGTFVVMAQMNFFRNVDLGFNKDAIVNVDLPDNDKRKLDLFRKQIESESAIEAISFSSSIPSGVTRNKSFTGIRRKSSDQEEGFITEFQFIDPSYIDLYKMEIVAGRNFNGADSLKKIIIINEALSAKFGFNNPNEAIGSEMIIGDLSVTIIGVIKDYYSKSLREEIDKVSFLFIPKLFSNASIKLSVAGNEGISSIQDKIQIIKNAWQVTYPESTMSYHFFDENVEAFYSEENKFSSLLQIFSLVLIFIGCLGLYGLTAFLVNSRMNEVALRKVFGATSINIVKLISLDFVWLIGFAFLIAAPISFYFMDIWLQEFAYHITIRWWMLILPALMVLLIALLSVSGQSLKAAHSNPAKILKYE